MKRKISLVLISIAIVAALSAVYFANGFRSKNREFKLLKNAYNTRLDYGAGLQAYGKIMSELSKNRHVALYNLANLSFREALDKASYSFLLSAIEYYKEALRIKPDFFEAKKNLEIAEMLKVEVDKNKNTAREEGDNDKNKDNKSVERLEPGLVPYEPTIP